MSRKSLREQVVATANTPSAVTHDYSNEAMTDIFGINVFNNNVMKSRLPKHSYRSLRACIDTGAKMDAALADIVASAMKDWALERGATHFAHVFYPLTGSTAEKHDSFIVPEGDLAVTEFSGRALIQGEPDASSFPNGGIRDTFEARGYSAWDVTSPAYLLESDNGVTLCIPTVFVSWTGEALDKKTPVLRSMQAVDKAAKRVLALFGHKDIARVTSFAGPEQEYFLVDSQYFNARQDLLFADRALFGAMPAKGQEFSDHYFGAIPDRVVNYMMDVDRELWKLGIPIKTRHNEVAPGQYEIAPIFETANIATDHQQLTMFMMKRLARKHGLTCMFHEKPFKGVNGSGKHLNWSIGNSTQGNLLDPGHTPHENAQFLAFCAAVIRGVDNHAGLLRAAIASAANDHRLGAHEAPPAIMSVYLGDQLNDVFEQIKKHGIAKTSKKGGQLEVGVDCLPTLNRDAGDRNRTSPFAFTGNRFEFRAVGSSQTIAGPLVVVNAMMAESLNMMADELEAALKKTQDFNKALQVVIRDIYIQHGRVVFNGNGYGAEWQEQEAPKRGLKNLRNSAEALPEITSKSSIKLFGSLGILSKIELEARLNIYQDQYSRRVDVEANLVERMVATQFLPAAMQYQTNLAENAAALIAAGIKPNTALLKEVNGLIEDLNAKVTALKKVRTKAHKDLTAETVHCAKEVLPAMLAIRKVVDALELLVPDELWPVPTYAEMLFIK